MVQQGSTIEVFCCYAHEDKVFMDELKTHLGAFRKQNLIDIWDDGEIRAGAQWDQEIKEHLNKAGIILLLISPDFISSSYGYDTEMKRASERYGLKEAKIISVVLRPLNDWEKIPFGEITLGNLQALPTGARAVTMWENRDSAWSVNSSSQLTEFTKLLSDPHSSNLATTKLLPPTTTTSNNKISPLQQHPCNNKTFDP